MTVEERVQRCRNALDPFCVARLKSGWFCLPEIQPMGRLSYGVLYHDSLPDGFNGLDRNGQAQWGIDTAICGEAFIRVLGAAKINYETWCNVDPRLHTHITGRFLDESSELRVLPPRLAYDWTKGLRLDPLQPEIHQAMAALSRFIKQTI
jgi:hypothetical protein